MVRYEKVQFVSNEYFPEEFSSDGKTEINEKVCIRIIANGTENMKVAGERR